MKRLASLLFLLNASRYAHAQTATDGSVGPVIRFDEPKVEIGATLGSRRGDNLFHSFETFNIPAGGSTTFTGPDDIRNVITRVTGGETSKIEGALRSEVGSDGFFFINPAGVVISDGASIDVEGAFHLSDAPLLKFSDGTVLATGDAADSSLTIAAPEAFGFLPHAGGGVAINNANLSFASGQRLSISGSEVSIINSTISQQNADLHIRTALDGEIPTVGADSGQPGGGDLKVGGATLSTTNGAVTLLSGDIAITGGTILAITSDDDVSGDISLTGNSISLRGADGAESLILTDNLGAGEGGVIKLTGGDVSIVDSRIESVARGSGAGGDIHISADSLHLRGSTLNAYNESEAKFDTATDQYYGRELFIFSGGDGAVGSIEISGVSIDIVDTYLKTNTSGPGPGGDITIVGDALRLTRADISVSNRNTLTPDQVADAYVQTGFSRLFGLYDDVIFGADGSVGAISITGDRLLLNQSRIASTWFGIGSGGRIDLIADRLITRPSKSGDGRFETEYGTFFNNVISLQSDQIGDALSLMASRVDLQDTLVVSRSIGGASGGDINVDAHVFAARASAIKTEIEGEQGGGVRIASQDFVLKDDARISTDTAGDLSMRPDRSGEPGGKIRLTSNTLTIEENATVSSRREISDNGGSITITADELLVSGLVGSLPTSGGYGLYGYYAYTDYGGDIFLNARNFIQINGGTVATSSSSGDYFGSAPSGGNISITGEIIVLGRGSALQATGQSGNGGVIEITTDALLQTRRTSIDASSSLGINGEIVVNGLDNPNTSETSDLEDTFLAASSVLNNPCLAALLGRSELTLSLEGVDAFRLAADAPTSLLLDIVDTEQTPLAMAAGEAAGCKESN